MMPTPHPSPSREASPSADTPSHIFPAPPSDPPSAPASPAPAPAPAPNLRQKLEYVYPPVGRLRGTLGGAEREPVNEYYLDEMLYQVAMSRDQLYSDVVAAKRDLGQLMYHVESLQARLSEEKEQTEKFMKRVAEYAGKEAAESLLRMAASPRKRSRDDSESDESDHDSDDEDGETPPKKQRTLENGSPTPQYPGSPLSDRGSPPLPVLNLADAEFTQGGSESDSSSPADANPDHGSTPPRENPANAAPASPPPHTTPDHTSVDGEQHLALTKRPSQAQPKPSSKHTDEHPPSPPRITLPDPFDLWGPPRSTDTRVGRPRATRAPVTRARERIRTDPVSGEPVVYHYEETPEYKERMRLDAEWEKERAAEKAEREAAEKDLE